MPLQNAGLLNTAMPEDLPMLLGGVLRDDEGDQIDRLAVHRVEFYRLIGR
jgi:hypothetical protein